jgi:hypothetical protein
MYAVVEFIDTHDIAIVHDSWIFKTDESLYSYWPSFRGSMLMNAVTSAAVPQATWSSYRIRQLGVHGMCFMLLEYMYVFALDHICNYFFRMFFFLYQNVY